jgi:hypothetical protein
MIIPDLKRRVTSVISKRSASGDSQGSAEVKPEASQDADGEPDPKQSAAEDLLIAISEKSASKLKEALSNFHDLHQAMPPEDDEEENE